MWRRIEILPHTGELLLQDGGTHLRISADGLSVNVRRVDDENMAAAARWWAYSLRDLPIVHRDRYRYATQALDCIRANTPKVVVRDTRAGVVCKLMENDPLPLFEYLQEDGGCVRISLAHGRARIRMPVVVDEDQMAWPEGLVGAAGGMGRGQSSGQGTGQWFGIDLLGRLQLDTPEPVEVSVEREAVGVTVDIDDSWLPNPLPPPGWGQLLAQLSLAETKTLLPRGTEDEVDEGADHSVDDERHQSNIPHSALYVFSIVQRAQVAMTYCLTLERNYEARCADQTTQLGHHPADPFPVHLERRIFVEEGEANDKVVEADGERKRRVAVADSTTRVWHKVSEMGAAAAVGGSFPEQAVGKESTALVEEPVALEAEPSETDGEMHIASENDGEVDADTGVGEGASVDLEKSDSPFWNPSARKLQGIGWTWRTPKGDLRINFEDGVQITIGADGGTLLYCDVLLGEPQTYEMSSGGLPPYAKEKLPDVMKAIALLKDVDGIS